MATLRLPTKKHSAKARRPTLKELRRQALAAREERIKIATQWLIDTYPAFAKCLPLAIGINKQTAQERPSSVSAKALRIARKRWCKSPRYLSALAQSGSVRYHLSGEIAGPVSEEHRQKAAQALRGK